VLRLARRRFTPAEAALLEAEGDPERRAQLFMQLWTLKEAFVKAKGLGVSAPPGLKGFSIGIRSRMDLDDRDPSTSKAHLTITSHHSAEQYQYGMMMLQPHEGHVGAICLQLPQWQQQQQQQQQLEYYILHQQQQQQQNHQQLQQRQEEISWGGCCDGASPTTSSDSSSSFSHVSMNSSQGGSVSLSSSEDLMEVEYKWDETSSSSSSSTSSARHWDGGKETRSNSVKVHHLESRLQEGESDKLVSIVEPWELRMFDCLPLRGFKEVPSQEVQLLGSTHAHTHVSC